MMKMVDGKLVECSTAEVAAREAEEQAWAVGETERQALVQRQAQDLNERLAAKGDAKILALVNATPEQLVTYARNTFASLTRAEQDEMAAILYALAVAVRPQIR